MSSFSHHSLILKPYAESRVVNQRRMMHDEWTERILHELSRLEWNPKRRFQQPVELYALYEYMLGDAKSDVGVQWDAAIQQLRREGLITVDRAGYVVLTPDGRAEMPVVMQRSERRDAV